MFVMFQFPILEIMMMICIKRFRRIREAKKAGLDPKAALGFKVEHASEEPAAANDDAMKGGEE